MTQSRLASRLYAGFGLALGTLLVLVVMSYSNFQRLADANRWNVHTYQVLLQVRAIREALVTMETAARGFVNSNDEAFLPQYQQAKKSYQQHVQSLQALTRDNPDQQLRLQQLQRSKQEWEDKSLSQLFTLRRASLSPEELWLRVSAGTQERRARMGVLRGILDGIETEENRLLRARSNDQLKLQNSTRTTLLFGGIASICVAAMMALTVLKNARGLDVANMRLHGEIEERQRTEEALRFSEERFRAFMNKGPAIAYIKNSDGRFVYVNEPCAQAFTRPVEHWIGKTDSDFWPEEVASELISNDQKVLSTGETLAFTEVVPSQNGKSQYWLSFKFPLIEHGQKYLAGLSVDVTEQKTAEAKLQQAFDELERSNAELEQFAYVASHDLQEPLRAVSGCVQVLQRRYSGQLDQRADEFIHHAVDGAARMQTLINDLLAFSRVGTRGNTFTTVPLPTLLQTALANLRVSIAESNAQITYDDLPLVHGDTSQLAQVFQNLISNALKFRGDKQPQIHIGCRPDENHPNFWVLSVRDNGLGIDSKYFERIFVMFQRLHTRTEYAGTGIGLAICKKIIERHGGHIWVESQPGEGTTFFFSVPAAPSLSASVGPPQETQAQNQSSAHNSDQNKNSVTENGQSIAGQTNENQLTGS
jgi:PAS domain S-box-containing protein